MNPSGSAQPRGSLSEPVAALGVTPRVYYSFEDKENTRCYTGRENGVTPRKKKWGRSKDQPPGRSKDQPVNIVSTKVVVENCHGISLPLWGSPPLWGFIWALWRRYVVEKSNTAPCQSGIVSTTFFRFFRCVDIPENRRKSDRFSEFERDSWFFTGLFSNRDSELASEIIGH